MRLRWIAPLIVSFAFAAAQGCGDDEGVGASPSDKDGGTDAGSDVATGDATDGGGDTGILGDKLDTAETVKLSGLQDAVSVVRDKYGMVHIYARNTMDAFRVQGWMMAVDRAGQLEIARRLATGRLAELFGGADAGQIDSDITMRTIGLGRVAKQIYDNLDPQSEVKRALDAFSDGISQYNAALRNGDVKLPQSLPGMPPSAFTDWSPVDTLAMGRLQTFSLSYDADADISLTSKVDALRSTFASTASDPDVAKRSGILIDLVRFAPPVPNTPLTTYPDDPTQTADMLWPAAPSKNLLRMGKPKHKAPIASFIDLPKELRKSVAPFVSAVESAKNFVGGDEFAGSNNWAVAGAKTKSGNAIVANDPHLGLSSPMVFWPTHVVVENADDPSDDFEIIGLAFPGIPGVILGSNRTLAWGATTAGYDVTDVWKETLSSDGKGVVFKGADVPFEKVSETIKIADNPDYTWDVLVVPHHGPLVPKINSSHQVDAPSGTALSVRWTGHMPTGEVEAVFNLPRSKNVDDARKAMLPFGTGAQNWMFADSAGDIQWTAPAKLPYRDKKAYTWDPATFTGTLPAFVLDGESGDYEWTGEYLEEAYLPKLKTPAKGWIATANTDNVGSTIDNDPSNDLLPNNKPFYIGSEFAQGFRLGRIEERLTAEADGIDPDGMSSIQGDHKSALGSRLAQYLLTALQNAEAEKATAGAHPDLATVVADSRYAAADVPDLIASLTAWQTGGFSADAGINLDDGTLNVDAQEAANAKATVIFNAWIVRAIARTFEDELTLIGQSSLGSTYTVRGFIRLLEEDPTTLATYDAASGQSILWDDISTTATTESKDDRLVTAMLDAVDDLVKIFGADRASWRWGDLHRVRFDSLNPLWFADIPPTSDPVFPKGFPRHGDQWNVDASNFGITRSLKSDLNFEYGSGPVQRFVAEMTPTGPVIRNALPGGAVMDKDSEHFRDEAEYWRKNETHPIPFELDDVLAALPSGAGQTLFQP